MLEFASGMVGMGFLAAALFFLRFWRRTGDSLFAIFAVAFVLLAIGQAGTAAARTYREDDTWLFLLRLAAFALLFAGILLKNVQRSDRV
jgi:hypothetical protein